MMSVNQLNTNHANKKEDVKKLFVLICCFLFYGLVAGLEPPSGLSTQGLKAIALMIVAILLWVFEIIPICVSAVLLLVLPDLLGIVPMSQTFSNFMISTVIFIFSAFIIVQAFTNSGLANRISLVVSSLFGSKPDKVLLSFMLPTAILSMVFLDIPTSLIFSGLAYVILQKNNCMPRKSNFGRSMMIGIPIAAAIGGIGTPAGSGLNVLSISLLKDVSGIEINFLQWTIIGFPMALALTLIAWFIIKNWYPSEIKEVKGLEDVKQKLKDLGKMSTLEKKFSVIFFITLIMWFSSPWSGINPTIVAIITASVFFLPKINLAEWDKVKNVISWDSLFLVGTASSLAMMLVSTKASAWIANTFLSGFAGSSMIVLLLAVSAFGVFSHLIVPVANAVLAIAIPIVAILAEQAGINPIYLVMPIAFTASNVFLMPLDPIPLTSFPYGYWTLPDMIKPGFVISLVWIVLNVIFMMGAQIFNII